MELLVGLFLNTDALVGCELPGFGETVAAIHDRVTELGAHTEFTDSPDSCFGVVHTGVAHGRDAVANLLHTRYERIDVTVFRVQVAFVRPDSVVQPGEYVHIVTQTARQLLHHVNVRVYQTGKDVTAAQIDHVFRRRRRPFAGRDDFFDGLTFNDEDVIGEDPAVGIHRDNWGVLQGCAYHLRNLSESGVLSLIERATEFRDKAHDPAQRDSRQRYPDVERSSFYPPSRASSREQPEMATKLTTKLTTKVRLRLRVPFSGSPSSPICGLLESVVNSFSFACICGSLLLLILRRSVFETQFANPLAVLDCCSVGHEVEFLSEIEWEALGMLRIH